MRSRLPQGGSAVRRDGLLEPAASQADSQRMAEAIAYRLHATAGRCCLPRKGLLLGTLIVGALVVLAGAIHFMPGIGTGGHHTGMLNGELRDYRDQTGGPFATRLASTWRAQSKSWGSRQSRSPSPASTRSRGLR